MRQVPFLWTAAPLNAVRHAAENEMTSALRKCCCLLFAFAIPAVAHSQVRLRVSAGRLWQGSPVTDESGFTANLSTVLPVRRWLSVIAGIDVDHVTAHDRVSVCYSVGPDGACLHRPAQESTMALSALLDLAGTRSAALRPHVGVGVAAIRSLAPDNAGEQRQYLAGQVQGGLAWGDRPGWELDLRLRRLARWGHLPRHDQGALLPGVTF